MPGQGRVVRGPSWWPDRRVRRGGSTCRSGFGSGICHGWEQIRAYCGGCDSSARKDRRDHQNQLNRHLAGPLPEMSLTGSKGWRLCSSVRSGICCTMCAFQMYRTGFMILSNPFVRRGDDGFDIAFGVSLGRAVTCRASRADDLRRLHG